MDILLLAGSPSAPSRSTRLLHHAGDRLASLGHQVDKLNVVNLPAHALLHADFADPELIKAQAQVERAQAVVIATPVYKAAYSGILKTFLDVLPQNGLAGKLVLPLATGGSPAHMLALDYALRPVLSSLSARHILPSIYAIDAQILWDDAQGLTLDALLEQRLARGIENLSASLHALRESAPGEFTSIPFSQVRCSV
ncbi:NADPH-dependent FMN reductase [soil metagenome]